MAFPLPPNLTAQDEARHAPPEGIGDRLYGDTLWLSIVDPDANVFGIVHWHLSNKDFARYESLFVIDGVPQLYANKVPLPREPDAGPWSDGRLCYEVVEPFEHVKATFDWKSYAFDLDFRARFAAFDYHDSVRGDPLAVAYPFHTGHFEQAMDCTGTFEIRGGRSDTRQINCWSHRDHTWSDRFSEDQSWQVKEAHIPAHYWPSIQLEDKHINVFGLYFQNESPASDKTFGGFVSDKSGSRPMLDGKAWIDPSSGPECRSATNWRYELTMPDGEVIHVRSTRHHGTVKLWNRAENDLENRMDCYEAFVDWEVEETGETGTGVAEHSIFPVWPQWLV